MSVYSGESKDHATPYSGDILNLVVENAEDDLKMFNSVITLDFLEAYNAAGYNVVTEAEETEAKSGGVKAIISKVAEVVSKAVQSVWKFIGDWAGKMIAIITKDKETYNKFSAGFSANAVGYKTKFRPINNAFIDGTVDLHKFSDDMKDKIDGIKNDITKATDPADIQTAVDNVMKNIKDFKPEDLAAAVIFDGDQQDDYTIKQNDADMIDSIMKDPKAVKSAADKMKKEVKKSAQGDILKSAQDGLKAHFKDDKLGVAAANGIYRVTNTLMSMEMKYYSALARYAGQAVSEARRVFIAAARVKKDAAGNATEEAKHECAILEMASDIYMETALAMD